MARIMAIDYGKVRTGIAVSDNMQVIANALTTVDTNKLFDFLTTYFAKEQVETLVVGYPRTLKGEPAEVTSAIDSFIDRFKKKFAQISVVTFDERFTSKIATRAIVESGIGKKARQNKALIDKVSATIILENYLEWKR